MKQVQINLDAYLSHESFSEEGDMFLNKFWVFVGLSDEVPETGSYKPVTLWNHKYILANNGAEYRLFRNICPHRGSELVACAGKGTFTCPYHGWAFNSSGKVFVYNPKVFDALDRDLTLSSIKCAAVGKFIFATAACPETLENYLGKYSDYLTYISERMDQRIDTNAMTFKANWKIVVENTLESYHTRKVHPDSLDPYIKGESEDDFVNVHSSVVEQLSPASWVALQKTKKVFFGDTEFDNYRHTLIFPNLTIATSGYTNFFIQQFIPTDSNSSDFVSHGFLLKFKATVAEHLKKHFIDFSVAFHRKVFSEDKDVCERVHKGFNNVDGPNFNILPSVKEARLLKFISDVHSLQS
jgi:phenylpropionate dioxygenase-like ring-hydroxylating dioxygenase large terminal subunit